MHPFDIASFLLVTIGGAIAAAATIFGNNAGDGLAAMGADDSDGDENNAARARAREALAQSQRRNEVRRRSVISAGLVLVVFGVLTFVAARILEAPAAA